MPCNRTLVILRPSDHFSWSVTTGPSLRRFHCSILTNNVLEGSAVLPCRSTSGKGTVPSTKQTVQTTWRPLPLPTMARIVVLQRFQPLSFPYNQAHRSVSFLSIKGSLVLVMLVGHTIARLGHRRQSDIVRLCWMDDRKHSCPRLSTLPSKPPKRVALSM